MLIELMKSKIHRATVTDADLNYEGSISICPALIQAAGLYINEKVDIYNCNNGQRFTTYVIKGKNKQITLNGAAARLVQKGDLVIIVSYCTLDAKEAKKHLPQVVFVNSQNQVTQKRQEKAHGI